LCDGRWSGLFDRDRFFLLLAGNVQQSMSGERRNIVIVLQSIFS
jgi:hypothetical protein